MHFLLIGKLYFELNDYEKAMECFNMCIKLKPGESIFYLDIGKGMIQAEKYNESIEFLNKAIDLNPRNVRAFYLKGIYIYMCYQKICVI